jgi:cyclic pyranopterin phosphate synthase
LNISVDTLNAEKFRAVTRRGDLRAVLRGFEAAREAGFEGTKLNAVVMSGVNDDELPDLCRFAWEQAITPRFIEFMPMSDGALFQPGGFFPAAEMRSRIAQAFGPVEPAQGQAVPGVGPARYYRVASGGLFGIISAVTEPFCDTCNRVRLSATGRLHTCLALDEDADLRGPLRAGAGDEVIAGLVSGAVAQKREGHGFTSCGGGAAKKHMVAIGG